MANEEIVAGGPEADPLSNLTVEDLTAAGEALSNSLLFALRRSYLDGPIFESGVVRLLTETPPLQTDLAFVQVEQVGQPLREEPGEYLRAIRTALAAAHDPRYTLLFLISSDGIRSRIYLGVAARSGDAQPRLFAEQLGQFLSSSWPGTRVRPIPDYDRLTRDVHVPLSRYRYASAFTGIPSLKSEEPSGRPQTLDQLMRGMRGKPYLYMVIAEPMPEAEVADIVRSCRSLSGEVHAFTRATLNRSLSEGTSSTTSRTEGESSSVSTTTGTSESTTSGQSKGALGSMLEGSSGLEKGVKGAGVLGGAALLLAPGAPFLLSGMLGLFGQLLPSSTSSQTSGVSTSEARSQSRTSSVSESEGRTTGESLSFGREFLNKHAEACETLLERTVERFETARAQGCWNVGVYLLNDEAETATQARAQFKALISGVQSSYEPVRAHDLRSVWDGQVQVSLDEFHHPPLRLFSPGPSQRIRHPLGEVFEGVTTPLNTAELSLLANLPLREMPGLPVQPTAYFSLNPPQTERNETALSLGHLLEGGEPLESLPYEVDLDSLTRHVFVTGITGSGKSNTCRRLLDELMQRGVNFMVIEPAKEEYVRLALAYNRSGAYDRDIAVYVPGRSDWGGQPLDELRLNPFDVVQMEGAALQVMAHLDRLKSIFNASFPMQEILPVILEEALVDLYDSRGWLDIEPPPAGVGRPTLEQLFDRIPGLIREKGYEQRITDNITAALRTRIGSLLRGWKGRLFNHSVSTPWPDLFDRPVVVNLSGMGDDADKAFTMALLLNFLVEYRQAQHEVEGSPESGKLRHLAVFEEAHRVLKAAPPGTGSGNPQAKMGEMFADTLAEIRAYGQGLAIVDQVPAKLVPDALKNTNLKIIHRLVASDDRGAMAGTLALTPEQTEVIARLKVGQAIVAGIHDDLASWVRIFYTPIPGPGEDL